MEDKKLLDKIEKKIIQILKKEGGAAGLAPLKKATDNMDQPKGFNLKSVLKKMKNVEKHKNSDYILTPINEDQIRETVKQLVEELCKKGKAYRAKRMRAGEKSSAYLSGRAVKVCKGQMQGEHADPDDDDVTVDPDTNFQVDLKHLLQKHIVDDGEDIEEIDALSEDEEYCPKCADKLRETIKKEVAECWKTYKQVGMKKKGNKMVPNCVPKNEEVEEGRKKKKCKPSKGKRFAKRVDGKCRSFGQKGKASDGGDRIRPGTKKAHAYCARSAKIKKCKNPPCANTLSRRKWKCQGSRSVPE